MKRVADFNQYTDKESQNYLAQHYPKGRVTGKRFDEGSIIYKLILCLSTIGKVVTGQLEVFARNRNIRHAQEFLPEWEESVRIPEKYPRRETTAGRREAIERKVSKIPVYNVQSRGNADVLTTIEDYVYKITGLAIEIDFLPSGSGFPAAFPIQFQLTGGTSNLYFVIKVPVVGLAANNQFPIPFPMSFFTPDIPDADKEKLEIALNDVVPSFADWEYEILLV